MTIPIDPHYIPAFSIEDVLLDKDTGAPLSGGQVFFERDSQRGILKTVYQISGTSPDYTFTALPNPVILSSIGTFEDALGNPVIPYFYPYVLDVDNVLVPDLYYVRVLSSEDVPQFDREAQPYLFSESNSDVLSAFSNELSNPQFSAVNFDTTSGDYTYTVGAVTNQVIAIAPGWHAVVSCASSGTLIVSQYTPVGSENIITNPVTTLKITANGLSQCLLRQNLYGSPNLWGGGSDNNPSNISGTFVAKTYSGSNVAIPMYYSQSNGSVVGQLIVTGTVPSSGDYAQFAGSVNILSSDSNQFYPDAYVSIYFDMPLNTTIGITSVMVATTGETVISDIDYNQESYARQIDHLFHYYEPQLKYKPIPSLMTAWDFPLNPFQFGTSGSISTTPAYIADQTIAATSSSTMNWGILSYSGSPAFTSSSSNQAFYIMQYLDGYQALEMTLSRLASYLNVYQLNNTGVKCRVYLYYNATGGTIPTLPTGLGTVNADGTFNLTAANWLAIPQLTGYPNQFTIEQLTVANEVVLPGFNGAAYFGAATTAYFAMVVTFSCPISGTSVVINAASLMKGDIATTPGAQTYDQVLRECQYYYETSYSSLAEFTATPLNNLTSLMQQTYISAAATTGLALYASPCNVPFKVLKRTNPTLTFYDQAKAANKISATLWSDNAGTISAFPIASIDPATYFNITTKQNNFYMNPKVVTTLVVTGLTVSSTTFCTGGISFHWESDARLGKV